MFPLTRTHTQHARTHARTRPCLPTRGLIFPPLFQVLSTIMYNVLHAYPLESYGECLIIFVQNLILCMSKTRLMRALLDRALADPLEPL